MQHRTLLVHGLNIICKPSGYSSTISHEYLLWDSATQCSLVHSCATIGCRGGNFTILLAKPNIYKRNGRQRCCEAVMQAKGC